MRRTLAVSVALGCAASALLASAPAAQAMGGVCNGIPGYSHKGGDAATAAGHSWNTVRAFADAYAVGMDGVETDAQPDADGDILMFHNSTLDKVTDGTGSVRDSSTAYINSLHLHDGGPLSWWVDYLNQLVQYPTKVGLVELKNSTLWTTAELTDRLLAPASSLGVLPRLTLYSKNPNLMRRIEVINPAVKTGLKAYWANWTPGQVLTYADGIVTQSTVPADYVTSLHQAGAFVDIWGSNPAQWRNDVDMHADGILTGNDTEFSQYCGSPVVTSFSPLSGLPTSTVTITGSQFTGATAVQFGDVSAEFTINSDSQITATVPPTAPALAKIVVSSPAGSTRSGSSFKVPPTISDFTNSGSPGDMITLTGTTFADATSVTFGAVPATFTVDSNSQITATVPQTAPASAKIAVTTPGGKAWTSTAFKVPPAISAFTPTSGAPGDAVTITGANFTGATRVEFGTVPAAFVVDSDSQITVNVPGAVPSSCTLQVTTPGGKVRSGQTFTASTP